MTGILKIIFLAYIELSSLRSQLEYWNIGTLEYWVMAKTDFH